MSRSVVLKVPCSQASIFPDFTIITMYHTAINIDIYSKAEFRVNSVEHTYVSIPGQMIFEKVTKPKQHSLQQAVWGTRIYTGKIIKL